MTPTKSPQPLAGRLVNAGAGCLERLGIRVARGASPAALKAAASDEAGLSDWGDSAQFHDGLDRLLAAVAREADLNAVGRLMLRAECRRVLLNQLRIQAVLAHRPEIRSDPLSPPLIIVGFFRTGTTALQRLLGEDPRARSLPLWEAWRPVGAPGTDARSDRRLARARWEAKALQALLPARIHAVHPESPEESLLLLHNTFASLYFWALFGARSYLDWLLRRDGVRSYEYVRTQLQILQVRERRDHWVLKSGNHLLDLPAVCQVFPEASFVWTHREPREFVPSLCSLAWSLQSGLWRRAPDPKSIGAACLDLAEAALRRGVEARNACDPSRFLDLEMEELASDPLGCVERLYQWRGVPLSSIAKARMARWCRDHPRHAHGRHRYSLDVFGLDADQVEERLGFYRRRFPAR